ncbi:MAG: hypothetical protein WA652_14515 [Xanthobacteraceae bacterium]
MEAEANRRAVPPPIDRESLSLQDQQFEQRRRIAERLIQALRQAGYSCGLADDAQARTLKNEN